MYQCFKTCHTRREDESIASTKQQPNHRIKYCNSGLPQPSHWTPIYYTTGVTLTLATSFQSDISCWRKAIKQPARWNNRQRTLSFVVPCPGPKHPSSSKMLTTKIRSHSSRIPRLQKHSARTCKFAHQAFTRYHT